MKLLILLLLLPTLSYAESFDNCHQSDECTLVQTNFCKKVEAVNKKFQKDWESVDLKDTVVAQGESRSCTPIPREDIVDDYKIGCIKSKCTATRVVSW